MIRHQLGATLSELHLLAEELQSLTGVPDAMDRARASIWHTAHRLERQARARNGETAPASISFSEMKPIVPLDPTVLN